MATFSLVASAWKSTRITLASMPVSTSSAAWKGSLVPFMKTRPCKLHNRVVHAALRDALIDAVAGKAGLKVGRAQHAAGAFVTAGGDGVEIVDQVALVPHVVAGGEHVGAHVEDLLGELRGQAEASGGIFGVDDGEVDRVRLADVADVLADDFASRAAEDVADKEDVQKQLLASSIMSDRLDKTMLSS